MNGNEVTTTTRKGITGTGIKIIALVTMLIDHFASFVLENYLATIDPAYGNVSSSNAADSGLNFDDGSLQLFILITFLHLIGRFAFPLFIFLVVEGFTHTRSVYRYALNMFIFALVSQLPYNLVHGGLLRFEELNIFATLLMGILCMWCIKVLGEDRTWSHKLNFLYYITSVFLGAYAMWLFLQNKSIPPVREVSLGAAVAACSIAGIIGLIIMIRVGGRLDADGKNRFTFKILPIIAFGVVSHLIKVEYGVYGVMAIAVMYLLRSSRVRAYGFSVATLTVYIYLEAAAFFMIPVVKRYNGERGMKINKYFFYAFYPMHLLILFFIAWALGFTTLSIF